MISLLLENIIELSELNTSKSRKKRQYVHIIDQREGVVAALRVLELLSGVWSVPRGLECSQDFGVAPRVLEYSQDLE